MAQVDHALGETRLGGGALEVFERRLEDLVVVVVDGNHLARVHNLHGLDTWESFTATKDGASLRITSMPGKHGPGPLNALLPPVMGSMLEFKTAEGAVPLRLYITGDTLVHDDLKEIPRRYPEIDLALFHLGGTRIMGILLTMDAEQGVEAIRIVNPREVIPIHYNDYEVFKSPLEDFKRAAEAAGLAERMIYLSHGETYDFEVPQSRWQAA